VGGLGAAPGGGGGGPGGCEEAVTDCVSAIPDGLRDAGGGMGGFLPIGGGFGLNEAALSDEDVVEVVEVVSVEANEIGRRLFFSWATEGIAGAALGGGGGGAPGGIRAAVGGCNGAVRFDVSGSDRYGELLSAPVSMLPRVLRNFGRPPASIPANCGGPLMSPPSPPPPPPSLLLLARLGVGGASEGRFGMLGTGGAPPIAAGGPSDFLSRIGADLSLI
jgi:hypothetical protein